ncbi:MAG: serine protease [Pseudonocardia sp.]
MSRRNWPREFRAAASTFDATALDRLAHEYAAHLYDTADLPGDVAPVLQVLRQSRRYEALESVADAALAHGLDSPVVRRQYAQALVDGGNPAVALRLYASLAADDAAPRVERVEGRGGVGRCYKAMFLACTEPSRRRRYLTRSSEAYLSAYRDDPDANTWHGINAVALLDRAIRDGIDVAPGAPAPRSLAGEILRTVDAVAEPNAWTDVTACEAALALGRHEEAVQRAEAFLETKPHAFTIATFLRQVVEIWQLDTGHPPGDALLPLLRSALLDADGGAVTVGTADVRASRLEDDFDRLERILGTDRYLPLRWYRTGLVRCRAVARIETELSTGVGTGFLVAGPDLHQDLPPLVVVTNGHVVPERLRLAEAYIAFHGLDEDPGRRARFRPTRQWWYRPSARKGLDTTILELDGYPVDVVPLPPAVALPVKPLRDRRAYVIGHPLGMPEPQFSLQDNLLLDYDSRVLHYRSPTESGSSGSPVFDEDWHMIGLHHAGGTQLPQLNNAGGTYAANEGITIDAIRGGLSEHPPGRSP